MLNRLPTRLARPSSSLLFHSQTSARAAASLTQRKATPFARSASTAHGSDHHGDHHEGGHDSHFDAPSGWLWGQRPGEKYEKEGWEGLAWVFVASWVVAVAAYTMKEDTSIQTWALEEARRRLETEGFYEETK